MADTGNTQGAKWRFEMLCSSHTGCLREHNEDNFCFFGKTMPLEHQSLNGRFKLNANCIKPIVVGVFDGMGGQSRGELASFAAAQELARIAAAKDGAPWDDETLVQLIRHLNSVVLLAGEDQRATNTGTTATLLALDDGVFRVVNVGDSPAFLIRDGEMTELTVRHTDQKMLESLGITGRRSKLMQYLGVPEDEFVLEPDIALEEARDGDLILLCTDGLTDIVDQAAIQKAMETAGNLRDAYAILRDQALKNGGRDNITVLLCRLNRIGHA